MTFFEIIKAFRRKKILVIGDLILDYYIWGRVNRISPEAPVPIVEVTRESLMLGGAANVAHNITSLGAAAAVVGVKGRDAGGQSIIDMLADKGVDCRGIFDSRRPTTVKTRVIAHNQQVVRFDKEDSSYLEGKVLKGVIDHVNSVSSLFDAIIISDYRKGVITSELIRSLQNKRNMKKHGKAVFIAVDPKVGHFNFYKGVSLITPNIMEASIGSNIEIRDERTLIEAGRSLMKKLGCKAVLITRGEQGMSLFEGKGVSHIPTVARKVYDVTGAGDTVISAFTLAYVSGASMEQAAHIANHAAGVVVGEIGTAVATPDQLRESFS